jgi:dTDP-4-dehydrorhamnose reductase
MRILIVGAGGRLGTALVRAYQKKFDVVGFNRSQLDLAKPDQIRDKCSALNFDLLINCAAFTNVDRCETKREEAFAINANGPKILAEICSEKNVKLIHFSTDYVFDGEKRQPYIEDDVARPISVYGESKRAGEKFVLQADDRHLVVRVSWVFGPGRPSFVDAMIKRAREEEQIAAIADKWSTPTSTTDIAEMLPRVFDVDAGVLHFANAGQCTWQEYAQHALDCCRVRAIPIQAKIVDGRRLTDVREWVARRPVYSVLSTAKYQALTGITPRSWRDAVVDYIEHSYSKK